MTIFSSFVFAAIAFTLASQASASVFLKISVGGTVYVALTSNADEDEVLAAKDWIVHEQDVIQLNTDGQTSIITAQDLHTILAPHILPKVDRESINPSFLIGIITGDESTFDINKDRSKLYTACKEEYPTNTALYDEGVLYLRSVDSAIIKCNLGYTEPGQEATGPVHYESIGILAPQAEDYDTKYGNLETKFGRSEIILLTKTAHGKENYNKWFEMLNNEDEARQIRFCIMIGANPREHDFRWRKVDNVKVLESSENLTALRLTVLAKTAVSIQVALSGDDGRTPSYMGPAFYNSYTREIAIMTDTYFGRTVNSESQHIQLNTSNFLQNMSIFIFLEGWSERVVESVPEIYEKILVAKIRR